MDRRGRAAPPGNPRFGCRSVITTLTPNPSFDHTLWVDKQERGGLIRASAAQVECAGKGVNVARALRANGHAARAVYPANESGAAAFAVSMDRDGVRACVIPVRGAVRTNFTLIEPDSTITKINEPGPELSMTEAEALVTGAVTAAADSVWLVASGSLPPGVQPNFFAQLAAALPEAGCELVVDTSGSALRELVGTACAVVKPNLAELSDVASRQLHTVGDVVDAAADLQRRGWHCVLVSLGSRGCVLVDDDVHYGTVTVSDVRNTVGAGDALLAGFVSAGGRGLKALAEGLAWAAAAVRSPCTVAAAVDDSDRRAVTISAEVPSDQSLSDTALCVAT